MTTKRNARKSLQNRAGSRLRDSPNSIAHIPAAWITAILVFTFLAYLPVLQFEYVYDDVEQIVKNTHIRSWQYLSSYFTQSLWSHGDTFQVRFYRPLFLLWLRLNDALFNLNASYWHLTTLLSHLCATFLVYLLVRRLSQDWVPAIFSALLFGLHPIHIQVVAWNSAVSESLLATSLLGSLTCYVASVSQKAHWRLAASLVLYASALLLKETAIVFPAIVFAYSWMWYDPKKQTGVKARLAFSCALPFLMLSIAYLLIRAIVLHVVVTNSAPMNASTLLLSLPSIILTYIRLLSWPTWLSPMYKSVLVTDPRSRQFLVPFLGCVILAASLYFVVWRKFKHASSSSADSADRRLLILACLWGIVFILPALYLPALNEDALVQDRYLYVPSAGLAIAAGLILASIGRNGKRFLAMPWPQVTVAGVLTILMAVGIRQEVYVWANDASLFTRATERSPENKIARHDLAAALLDAGRYDEGIALLRKLLREDPNNYVDNNNIGQAYLDRGDRADAEGFLAKSCQSHPTARCLYQLGAVRFNLGRSDDAEQSFREAIAMDPTGVRFHSGLGLALERLGKPDLAKEAFQQELAINPGDPESEQGLSRLSATRPE